MPQSPYMKKLQAAMGDELVIGSGVGAVIRNERGDVLITRRSDDGTWDIPAGSVEPGETPAESIRREVHEETGLDVRVAAVAGVFGGKAFRHTYPNGDRVEAFSVIFDCEVVGGTLQSRDGEVTEFRYVAPAALPPLTWAYPRELFETTRSAPVFL
jgi:mutator protein MutT